jgi:tetrahydromethanopterin S-methyltransferase subunit A
MPKYNPKEDEGIPVEQASYDSNTEWKMDPTGFFTIMPFPDEKIIRVRYYIEEEGKYKKQLIIEGKTAEEIVQTIVRKKLVSSLQHAGYLGAELMKAETAMHLNLHFNQDDPLDYNKKAEENIEDNSY